jgi:hypothetical protein
VSLNRCSPYKQGMHNDTSTQRQERSIAATFSAAAPPTSTQHRAQAASLRQHTDDQTTPPVPYSGTLVDQTDHAPQVAPTQQQQQVPPRAARPNDASHQTAQQHVAITDTPHDVEQQCARPSLGFNQEVLAFTLSWHGGWV